MYSPALWVWLETLNGIAQSAIASVLEHFGSPTELYAASVSEIQEFSALPKKPRLSETKTSQRRTGFLANAPPLASALSQCRTRPIRTDCATYPIRLPYSMSKAGFRHSISIRRSPLWARGSPALTDFTLQRAFRQSLPTQGLSSFPAWLPAVTARHIPERFTQVARQSPFSAAALISAIPGKAGLSTAIFRFTELL